MEQLEAYGYRLENIQLKEKDKLLYVKILDKSGKSFYLDLEGRKIEVEEEKSIILERGKETIAPNSLLRGGLSCVEPEISAVAVECKKGVCILSRGQRFNLQEDSFLCGSQEITWLRDSACYPVVKFSELCTNFAQMEKSLQICAERISKSELKACCTLLEEVPCALKELGSSWDVFSASFQARKKELLDSICELEKYKCSYERNCNTACEKYQVVLYNIKVRRAKLEDLISVCKSLYCVRDTLLGITQELKADCSWLEKEICDLKFVIPLPQGGY